MGATVDMVDTATGDMPWEDIEDMVTMESDLLKLTRSRLLMLPQMLLLKLNLAMLTMEDTEAMEVMVWDMDMVTVSTMARGLLMPSLAMDIEVMGMAMDMEAMDTVDTDMATMVR